MNMETTREQLAYLRAQEIFRAINEVVRGIQTGESRPCTVVVRDASSDHFTVRVETNESGIETFVPASTQPHPLEVAPSVSGGQQGLKLQPSEGATQYSSVKLTSRARWRDVEF